jgi:adenosylcobinamide-phosphate synthase
VTTVLVAAFCLDLLLGDPRWLPHPVRAMGWAAGVLERILTRRGGRSRWAGILLVGMVVGGTGVATRALLARCGRVHPRLRTLLDVALLYTALSARDLEVESMAVARALARGDLPAARRAVAMIVGRDTADLEEREVIRAAVEAVAESTVDGVLSPLVYAAAGGAPAALAFKAASTLDSLVGHQDDRYREVGWAAARLDDLLNFLPARLARLLFPAGALLCGLDAARCWRIAWRDGARSPSPNAGLSEAAVAGALGVRLGGVNTYGGEPEVRPFLGDALRPLEPADIGRAVRLMYAASLLGLGLLVAVLAVAGGGRRR